MSDNRTSNLGRRLPGEEFSGPEYSLVNRKSHLRRLKWAARRIDDAEARTAYETFTADQDYNDDTLTMGRILVLLDQHDLLEER
jgi:hypothetical protein